MSSMKIPVSPEDKLNRITLLSKGVNSFDYFNDFGLVNVALFACSHRNWSRVSLRLDHFGFKFGVEPVFQSSGGASRHHTTEPLPFGPVCLIKLDDNIVFLGRKGRLDNVGIQIVQIPLTYLLTCALWNILSQQLVWYFPTVLQIQFLNQLKYSFVLLFCPGPSSTGWLWLFNLGGLRNKHWQDVDEAGGWTAL